MQANRNTQSDIKDWKPVKVGGIIQLGISTEWATESSCQTAEGEAEYRGNTYKFKKEEQ